MSKKQPKCAAILTIKKPGAMSEQGRKDIADWLRQHAKNLLKYGKDYNDKGDFRGKYFY